MNDEEIIAAVIAAATALLASRNPAPPPRTPRWVLADRLGDQAVPSATARIGSRWAAAGRLA